MVTGAEDAKPEPALYAHPSLTKGIEQFPDDFLVHLSAADESKLRAIAEQWAATMSTPDYTHSVSGDRLTDDWTVEDAVGLLTSIAELARQRIDGQAMYLLTEA